VSRFLSGTERLLTHFRYITRADHSPLFDLLPAWRSATLAQRPGARRGLTSLPEGEAGPVRFPTDEPLSSGDEAERTGPAAPTKPRARKTSSWVRWWGRASAADDVETGLTPPPPETGSSTPEPRSTASSPRMVRGVSFFTSHWR
jgi:hypothetical protein